MYVPLHEKLVNANRRPPAQLQQHLLPLQQTLLLQLQLTSAAAHHAAPRSTS
jgi:hypothetical protein